MEPMFDFSKLRVVDQHCHLIPNGSSAMTRDFFVKAMTLESYHPEFLLTQSLIDRYVKGTDEEKRELDENYRVSEVMMEAERSGETTLMLKEFLKEFASFLQCPKDLSTVLKSRNSRALSYESYVKEMFSDARISTLILSDYPYLPFTDQKDFPAAVLKHKLVLPSLIFDKIEASEDFDEAAKSYVDTIDEYLGSRGFVGIKSMIAYGGARRGSGLDIGNPERTDAAREFELYKEKKGQVHGSQIKNLQDYFHRLALSETTKYRKTFEFHTGIGDVDIVADKCNPMLLANLLRDENFRKSKIILLHAGYPYVAEAGWVTHFFPQVYLDSSIVFFTHFGAAVKRIGEMLEMAPYSKVLYSSDGMIPELQWFNAKFAKRVLAVALQNLVDAGTLNEEEARDLAESYLHGNAERLYGLN